MENRSKMPKIKKKTGNEENMPVFKKNSKKNSIEKYFKPTVTFDMKRILKERQADAEYQKSNAELDKEINAVNILYAKELKKLEDEEDPPVPPKLGFVIFDYSKYNTLFQIENDTIITSNSQQFIAMSIVKNNIQAKIHFENLLTANWLPVLDDIKNVLFNWGADMNTLTKKPILKNQVYDNGKIGWENFELVLKYLTISIRKNCDAYNDNDLLTFAKFSVAVYFDHHCGQMKNSIKKLFVTCVETAFRSHDETSIIMFAQELYFNNEQKDLFKMVVDLFLPLEGIAIEKLYTYLTYKLFKSLLGKANNINPFPSSIKDWFVQDLVNKSYFEQKHKVLPNLIRLLEHVVAVFNLYDNEQKLSDMYAFLSSMTRPVGLSKSRNLINILDQWRLRLFHLRVSRQHILE